MIQLSEPAKFTDGFVAGKKNAFSLVGAGNKVFAATSADFLPPEATRSKSLLKARTWRVLGGISIDRRLPTCWEMQSSMKLNRSSSRSTTCSREAGPGIHGPTGPHVTYPEYTKPLPIQNGFNPSDKVQTRVSRLYYYRDVPTA